MPACPLGSKRHNSQQAHSQYPFRIHCKTVSTSARIAFGATREPKVKTLANMLAGRTVSFVQLTVPFVQPLPFFLVRQSKSPEDREFGRRFARLWEVLVPKLREVFSDHDPTIEC